MPIGSSSMDSSGEAESIKALTSLTQSDKALSDSPTSSHTSNNSGCLGCESHDVMSMDMDMNARASSPATEPAPVEAVITTPVSSPPRGGTSETRSQSTSTSISVRTTLSPVSSPSRGSSAHAHGGAQDRAVASPSSLADLDSPDTVGSSDNETPVSRFRNSRADDNANSFHSAALSRDGPSVPGLDDQMCIESSTTTDSSSRKSPSILMMRPTSTLEDSLVVSFSTGSQQHAATTDRGLDSEIEVCRRTASAVTLQAEEGIRTNRITLTNTQALLLSEKDSGENVGRATCSDNGRGEKLNFNASYSKHRRSESGDSVGRARAISGASADGNGSYSNHRRSQSCGASSTSASANAKRHGGGGGGGSAIEFTLKEDEKKEMTPETSPEDLSPPGRTAGFAGKRAEIHHEIEIDPGFYTSGIKFTESDVCSVGGLPSNLQSQLQEEMEEDGREKILQRLDGFETPPRRKSPDSKPQDITTPAEKEKEQEPQKETQDKEAREKNPAIAFMEAANSALNYLLGIGGETCQQYDEEGRHRGRWDNRDSTFTRWENSDDTFALLGCAAVIHQSEERVPAMATSLVRVTNEAPAPSYAETIHAAEVDPRMQAWVASQFSTNEKPPKDGSYHLGKSRTVIVHEIVRRSWTWCTAWSPNGDLLAVGTENHHLAVIDTKASTVWRVRHDKKINGPVKNGTTHSIRSIAWGAQFIAIGGTGNAVSILFPTGPYPVLHTITKTGFVGSLSWKVGSSVLAIGSRLEKAMIVRIKSTDSEIPGGLPNVESEILYEVGFKNWVNCVAFSPSGAYLAVGDAGGILCVYSFVDEPGSPVEVNVIKSFVMKDSILAIEWSPDGKWLYAGGEDFNVSAIKTEFWEIVHQVHRNRWVQCISSSNSGTHVAVGGVSSEISILDVEKGWESVMGIELKGLVPLSAKWHPKDQYLTVTGQNNSILAVETTNARHVAGHHIHSISPILSIEFSPDGRMAIIGNKAGVVTFFSLSGSTFVTAYELVVCLNDKLSIQWSLNGLFTVIGSKDALIIVRRKTPGKGGLPSASGFSVRKVIRELDVIRGVSIDPHSQYVAVSGSHTQILDAHAGFAKVQEFKDGPCLANAWSPDGRWLATIGKEKVLTIYDTGHERLDRWRPIFSLKCDFVGRALAWGPLIVGGLLYLAYGGDGDEITIMEIRTLEGTWETVLRVPRDGAINSLDWNTDGLLAAAIGNGTVCIVDLAYLQSGVAVNEMDYDWQRQALTCFTEIRRNRGKNSMCAVRWIPSAPGSDSLLAVGGTDGELEIVDLTERRRCRGYVRGLKS
jgi:WD40 repeat protein